jgi:hypothetical protein
MGATSTKNCRYFFVDAVYATVSRINCPAGATFSKSRLYLGKSVVPYLKFLNWRITIPDSEMQE